MDFDLKAVEKTFLSIIDYVGNFLLKYIPKNTMKDERIGRGNYLQYI